MTIAPGLLSYGKPLPAGGLADAVRLVNTKYNSHTERAYVEFRAPDHDGDEIIVRRSSLFARVRNCPNPKSNKRLSGKRVMR